MADRNTRIRGSQILDGTIDVDELAAAVAGDGIVGGTGTALKVNVDDSTIEISADTVQVKDAGIDENKLASSVAGDGLTGGGGTALDVGAGDGLTVGTDQVDLNLDGTTLSKSASGLKIANDGVDEPQLAMGNAATTDTYIKYDGTNLVWSSVPTADVQEADFVESEVPSGTIDGTNTDFTLANSPVSNSVGVYLNGLKQEAGTDKDYTLSGTTISFNTVPASGDLVLSDYVKT